MSADGGLKPIFIAIAIGFILLASMNMITYMDTRDITSRVEDCSRLEKSLGEVQDKVSELQKAYTSLAEDIGRQLSDLWESLSIIPVLIDNTTLLYEEYGKILEEVSYLETWLSDLGDRYNQLMEDYQDLYNRVIQLEREVEELKQQESTGTAQPSGVYEELVSMIQPWYFYFVSLPQFSEEVKEIVSEAMYQPVILDIIDAANITSSDDLSTRIWKTINYTSLNLVYMRDTYVRVPTIEGTIRVWGDAIQLSSEVVKNGGGDCEDLSLLVYSVLKLTAKPGEEVYILMMTAQPEGHTVVIVIDKNNKVFYIVDPSSAFVNGYVETIEIIVETRNGIEEKNINPMGMHPGLKQEMLRVLKARISYLDIFEYIETSGAVKNVYYEPRIYELPPGELTDKYLYFIGLDPTKYYVVSNDALWEFASQEDFLQWVSERLSS